MDGYREAWYDIKQAINDVPCRCPETCAVDRCLIYWADVNAIVQGALRGCEPP